MKKSFASDNNSPIHPKILEAIINAQENHYISYGDDKYTREAEKVFKHVFGDDIEVFFMLTGTGANVCALQAFTDRFEAVISTENAHLNVDECGAVEHALGSKILTVTSTDGKLKPAHINNFLHLIGDQHHVQPKIISVTQATELGTVYTIDELKAIIKLAHNNGMKMHIDGARLANAAVYLNCSLKEITTDLNIDVLSFGGTKKGRMIGEAVVFFKREDAALFPFIRKQNMQLLSKMRYLSAQFIPYLADNIWMINAKKANNMTSYLYEKLKLVCPKILLSKPQANSMFVKLPKRIAKEMLKERFFYIWDTHKDIYRFMISYDTNERDVDEFVEFILKYMNK